MAKIWRNRILAGTQKLADCPNQYKNTVIDLIKDVFESGKISKEELKTLVSSENISESDYEIITEEEYTI